MNYFEKYSSPVGEITMASDGRKLTGLWFDGQKYFGAGLEPSAVRKSLPVFEAASRWLDLYFSGKKPDFDIPLELHGSAFRLSVWRELLLIPYGKTTTYGAIAAELSKKLGKKNSARAVGGAVGHNPVSVIVPCHRVLGANKKLTGYAGGLDIKAFLLELEAQ